MKRTFARLLILATFLGAPSLAAQSESAKREARERFDRGLRLFNQGDDGGALAEFRRAYELIPHPLVLYNTGVVLAAMRRPVEALDALDRLLASPGDVSADRLEHARRLRAEQSARVAELAITSNVAGARIEIDGVEVGQTPLAEPLKVASGERVVALIAPGHAPSRRRVTVAGGRRATLDVKLDPVEGRLAMLSVSSTVPDAEILIDGKPAGKTPLAGPLAVVPGKRVVDVRRAGYRSVRRVVDLAGGASAKVDAPLVVDPGKLTSDGGKLALVISEPDAVVFVDGAPRGAYAGPIPLPAGLHRVRVERAEFFPFERDVEVPRGGSERVEIELLPTPEKRAAYRDAATSQRTWGWVSVGAGAAIVAGGAAFLLWNRSEQSDAEDRSDALAPQEQACLDGTASQKGINCAAVEEQLRIVIEDKDAVNSRYPWGFAAVGLGVVGVGLGVYLLVSNDDPDRYEPRPESDVFGRVRVLPSFGAGNAALTVQGAF